MKEEIYKKENSTYEQVRWDTLCAILKSQLNIDIYEAAGMLEIVKDGQPFASIKISGENTPQPQPVKDAGK